MSEAMTGKQLNNARRLLTEALRITHRKTDDYSVRRLVDWLYAYLENWGKDLQDRDKQAQTGMFIASSSYASNESPGRIAFYTSAKATRPTVTTASKWLTRLIREVALAPYDVYRDPCKPLENVDQWVKRIYPEPRYNDIKLDAVIQTLQGLIADELGVPEGFSHEIVSGPDLILGYAINPACMSYAGHYLGYQNIYHNAERITSQGYLDRHPGLELYSANPDKVNLVIVKEKDKPIGRILLWHLDDGQTALDSRIYPSSHGQMIRYLDQLCSKEGWIRTAVSEKLRVTLKATATYPYLDTMSYYKTSHDGQTVILQNKVQSGYRGGANTAGAGAAPRGASDTVFKPNGEAVQIPGGYASLFGKVPNAEDFDDGSVYANCHQCGHNEMCEDQYGDYHGTHDANGNWYCEGCATEYLIYLEPEDEYFHRDDLVYSDIDDTYMLEDDAVFSEWHDTYIDVGDAERWEGGYGVAAGWFHQDHMYYIDELDISVPEPALPLVNTYIKHVKEAGLDPDEVFDQLTDSGYAARQFPGLLDFTNPNFLNWLKGTYHVEPVSTTTVS